MNKPQEATAACSSFAKADSFFSVFTVAIDADEAPEWVELIPAGKFSAVDGRGPFENTDPDSIIAASVEKMPQVGLVLDYDHSTDLAAPEGRPAPAAGWLKQFKVEHGAILARIEWTADAAEAVKAKKYRYISPVFEHSKDGKVERILRAALTNNPALINLPALASESGHRLQPVSGVARMAKDDDGKKMKLSEVMAVLEEAYPDAGPEKLMKAAACLMADDDGEPDGDEHMDEADGDPYESETSEQMAARQAEEMANCASDGDKAEMAKKHMAEKERFAKRIKGLEVQNRNEKMAAKEIEAAVAKHPMVVKMASDLNQMRATQAKACATEKVDAAIRDGRLIPSQRDWAISYCATDTAGFDKFIAAQPKIIQSGSDGTFTGRIGEAKEEGLSQKELIIAQNLGLPAMHAEYTVIAADGTIQRMRKPDRYIELFAAAKKGRLSQNVHLD